VTIDSMRRTVVIVDDHEQFRRSARKLLELEGFAVIGEAGTVARGLAAVERLRPDVVLLDVALPDGSGFELAPTLSAVAGVVIVSSRDPSGLAARARRAGALAFIPKDELSGEAISSLLERHR
jgi:DNA-binding NarL/FixJ family response regulator